MLNPRIETVADAFSTTHLLTNNNASDGSSAAAEDAFGVFTADFIIDKELDVWLDNVDRHILPDGDFRSYLTNRRLLSLVGKES